MGKFQAAGLEILADGAIGRRGEEQYHGRRHDVVDEAGLGDLLCTQTAADAVVALEEEHLVALLAEHCGRDKRIYAAADDDVVMIAHCRCPS